MELQPDAAKAQIVRARSLIDLTDNAVFGELEEIDESECWPLLASQPVGRLAVVVGHYPLVFPVNHVVHGPGIVFRSGAGTKLWAVQRSNVTFRVDHVDVVHRTGWSVLARGVAHEVLGERHAELVGRLDESALVSYDPRPKEHLVGILVDSISGRRLRPEVTAPATGPRGYI